MYIDRIQLRNVKGFEKLSFNLVRPGGSHAGWTVFTGDNGAGKSTLLKAIALGLVGREVARSLQPNLQRWVRDGFTEGDITLTLQPEQGIDEYMSGGRTSYKAFDAVLTLNEHAGRVVLDDGQAKAKKAAAAARGPWSGQASGWFSCGYGPFRRVFGASSEATELMVAPITERYVTMFQEAASLLAVDKWLRDLSHKKLEKREAETRLLDLILGVLRDELMPNQITVDTVDSDGLWLKDRNGLRLAWPDMSDGYRAALALLIDILRHLVKAYGFEGLTERDEHGRLTVVRSGVVMIDEIDAHLHPEWQQKIGFWLKQHFPRIQFLVTTHSPIICQAADPNGLFVLPEPGSQEPARALSEAEHQLIISARPDTILLSRAFGLQNTRSPRAVEARARYSALKAKLNAGVNFTPTEKSQFSQLKLFVQPEAEN
ncbi:AAA family ATPase [Rubrivivax benzoatilyticus]|uniref:AAA family ATPase n=1 Tax=Rubrivivax benzoatilyticus TaxID=316997 RepID=A0ABX0HR93_9BURK|nr:AAA family ATPase [Rubrivivax benzoatilyticus]EGJ08741.1 AAA ATPase [Rubrivivax benzoatilyticus JA2 = ATCC BAA-35]NHK97158.1 AAA family ATPase [Rubrivivax benzoatilyticus]NHL23147.1 AAA family ATPase [Rubrivivax benzoatilyticus]